MWAQKGAIQKLLNLSIGYHPSQGFSARYEVFAELKGMVTKLLDQTELLKL